MPALNALFEKLFTPARQTQPDWLTKLELKFREFDLERPRIAFDLAAAVRDTPWSKAPTALDLSTDIKIVPDQYTGNRNRATVKLKSRLTTDTVAAARHAGANYRDHHCQGEPPSDQLDRETRRAYCDFAARLSAVDSVPELARAFFDSVADLSETMADTERDLLGAWKLAPTVDKDSFLIVATAAGSRNVTGKVEMRATAEAAELVANLELVATDAQQSKLVSLLWTYLGALIDADSEQFSTMQSALAEWIGSLRTGRISR